MMYLKNFNRQYEYTCFDKSAGKGSEFKRLDEQTTRGYCQKFDFGWVAVYFDSDKQTLVVQIDNNVWDLNDSNTTVTYEHQRQNDKTYFNVENDRNQFEITYDAWWTELPQPSSATMTTVRDMYNDEEEDIFAYIKHLSKGGVENNLREQ